MTFISSQFQLIQRARQAEEDVMMGRVLTDAELEIALTRMRSAREKQSVLV